MSTLIVVAAFTPQAVARQTDAEQLTALINAYRAAPAACRGNPAQPAPPLTAQAKLAGLYIRPGTILSAMLDRAGYPTTKVDGISISGADTAQAAMEVIEQAYCRTLLSSEYTEIGSTRDGNDWTVVLAHPAPPLPSVTYPDWHNAGQWLLDAVNTARASARSCGEQSFAAAPPLRWNPQLGEAALAHSTDMATQRYFDHTAKDGSTVAERAQRAGYQWSRIGENISFGQNTPQEAMQGWLGSPGHCANIMNPGFTDMGAAYGVTAEQQAGIIYWTQVFGKPRK